MMDRPKPAGTVRAAAIRAPIEARIIVPGSNVTPLLVYTTNQNADLVKDVDVYYVQ